MAARSGDTDITSCPQDTVTPVVKETSRGLPPGPRSLVVRAARSAVRRLDLDRVPIEAPGDQRVTGAAGATLLCPWDSKGRLWPPFGLRASSSPGEGLIRLRRAREVCPSDFAPRGVSATSAPLCPNCRLASDG